ncbi:MAG TPA: DUF2235 domain-containing protein [Gemmatimonadaceae bacterium]
MKRIIICADGTWNVRDQTDDQTEEGDELFFLVARDIVRALGAPGLLGRRFNKNEYQYHDVPLNDRILNAAQALAIDERRKPFAPSVWRRPPG